MYLIIWIALQIKIQPFVNYGKSVVKPSKMYYRYLTCESIKICPRLYDNISSLDYDREGLTDNLN